MWIRKKTQNLPTSYTSFRLNPHCLWVSIVVLSPLLYVGHPLGFGCPGGLGSAPAKARCRVVQLLGSQGFWQHQVLRGVGCSGSRKYSALEGHGNQYWPISSNILAWRTPLIEKPGRPQSTGSQRVGHDQSKPAHTDARLFFACGSSAPVRVGR